MNTYLKCVTRTVLILVSSIIACRLAYYVCVTYFFDTVIYYKSTEYGYWIPGGHTELTDFGRRAWDVIPLFDRSLLSGIPSEYRALQNDTRPHTFTIAMIGDSYVWGQGVLFSNSVSQVLERKLNAVRKTRVLSLASPGDDMVENYSKYLYLRDKHMDLYIFVPVNNDVMLNLRRDYDQKIYDMLITPCEQTTGHAVSGVGPADWNKGMKYYNRKIREAYANPSNICVLNIVAAAYPKDRAIYFIPDDYFNIDTTTHIYETALARDGLYILSSSLARNSPVYGKYFSDTDRYFHVSSLEEHPSALAHRMYADVLFHEITTNRRWNFVPSR